MRKGLRYIQKGEILIRRVDIFFIVKEIAQGQKTKTKRKARSIEREKKRSYWRKKKRSKKGNIKRYSR